MDFVLCGCEVGELCVVFHVVDRYFVGCVEFECCVVFFDDLACE